MRFGIVVSLLVGSFSWHASAAETYKWMDKDHNVYYSDTPPPDQSGAAKVKLNHNVVETEAAPYELTEAAKKNPVSIFTFPECGHPCDDAVALLEKRGIPYNNRNKEEDKLAVKQMTGKIEMPVIMIGKRTPIIGFQEIQLNSALDDAGYPSSNPFARLKRMVKNTFKKDKATETVDAKPTQPANNVLTINP